MDTKQLIDMIHQNSRDIVAIAESNKSAHKRLDGNERIAKSVNELAANVAVMAEQVKGIAERMDKSLTRIEAGQRAQGERLGNLEKFMATQSALTETISRHEERLDDLEREPGNKWKSLTAAIIGALAGGAVSWVFTILKGG